MRLDSRGVKIGAIGPCGGSCGSVLQTDLPCRQETGGLKTPGY